MLQEEYARLLAQDAMIFEDLVEARRSKWQVLVDEVNDSSSYEIDHICQPVTYETLQGKLDTKVYCKYQAAVQIILVCASKWPFATDPE